LIFIKTKVRQILKY